MAIQCYDSDCFVKSPRQHYLLHQIIHLLRISKCDSHPKRSIRNFSNIRIAQLMVQLIHNPTRWIYHPKVNKKTFLLLKKRLAAWWYYTRAYLHIFFIQSKHVLVPIKLDQKTSKIRNARDNYFDVFRTNYSEEKFCLLGCWCSASSLTYRIILLSLCYLCHYTSCAVLLSIYTSPS
jgi:hypothetical protein